MVDVFQAILSDLTMGRSPMLSLLESGEINRLVGAIQTCMSSVPISERQEVAEAAFQMIFHFTHLGSESIRARLIEVPGLITSLVLLWGEEALLKNSQEMVANVGRIAFAWSRDSPSRSAALIEAGWADLIVKALLARPDDKRAVHYVGYAVYDILFKCSDGWKVAFVAAGAEAALEAAIKRLPRGNNTMLCYTKVVNIIHLLVDQVY